MAADAKVSLQPSSGEGHAIRATPFIPSSVISDKNLLFTIDRWAPCSGRGMDYQKWMSSIGRLGRAFALGFAEGWTQDATPVNLLVQPSNISPPHSLDVSADDELSRMFAEALDDFDDAPVGTGRERHAFVGETHISPFLSLLLSSASLSPKHCGGRAQQCSSPPASDKWIAVDTSVVQRHHLQHEQLHSLPVADHTTSSYNHVIARSSVAGNRAYPIRAAEPVAQSGMAVQPVCYPRTDVGSPPAGTPLASVSVMPVPVSTPVGYTVKATGSEPVPPASQWPGALQEPVEQARVAEATTLEQLNVELIQAQARGGLARAWLGGVCLSPMDCSCVELDSGRPPGRAGGGYRDHDHQGMTLSAHHPEMLDYMSHHYPSGHQSMLPNEGGHVGQPMLSSGQQSMLPNEGGHDEQSMLPEYTSHNHSSGHQSKLPDEVGHGGQLVLPESVQQNVLPALGTVASLVLDSVDCYHGVMMPATQTKAVLDSVDCYHGVMMLATQTKAAQAAYHCLSPAKLQRRKQQKRRRRARLKQLADQQAAKQMRRRTISGKKQRHTHGDVRKKSAANRRHSADRASSWVNSLQGSQLAAM